MKTHLKTLALIGVLLPAALGAQEMPRRFYGPPLGLTEPDALRLMIVPAPIGIKGPAKFCDVVVTAEVLDATDLTVLASFGPTKIGVGISFIADFIPNVGAPPARQEVVVRTEIARVPRREAERASLNDICPLIGALQIYDQASGRTQLQMTMAWVNVGP